MKSHVIKIKGRNFHYLDYGNRTRPVLVLIHGFHACAAKMSDFADYISPYFHLIIPDLPGFGKSDELPSEFNINKSALEVLAFLKTIKIDKYFLSGFSMGGGVALEMLLTDPQGCLGTLFIYPLALGTHMKFSTRKKITIRFLTALAKSPVFSPVMRKMFYNDKIMYYLFKMLSASNLSTDIDLKRRIANSRLCSYKTYIHGVSSIFNFQPSIEKKFSGLKTILVLNKFDELIDPKYTLANYRSYFPEADAKYLNLGSHNPTRKENADAFNKQFPPLLQEVLRELGVNK